MRHNALMTKRQIKKLIAERTASLDRLQENTEAVGACWESEKLGFTKGYIHALKVMLGEKDVNWDFMGK